MKYQSFLFKKMNIYEHIEKELNQLLEQFSEKNSEKNLNLYSFKFLNTIFRSIKFTNNVDVENYPKFYPVYNKETEQFDSFDIDFPKKILCIFHPTYVLIIDKNTKQTEEINFNEDEVDIQTLWNDEKRQAEIVTEIVSKLQKYFV